MEKVTTQQENKPITRETFELIVKKLGTVYGTDEAIDSIWKHCQLYSEKQKEAGVGLLNDPTDIETLIELHGHLDICGHNINSNLKEKLREIINRGKREEIKPINIVFKTDEEIKAIYVFASHEKFETFIGGYKQAQTDIKKQLSK